MGPGQEGPAPRGGGGLASCPAAAAAAGAAELGRLRAEVERLRAERVPLALRRARQGRRVVVDAEPPEAWLRKLGEARRGWQVLLARAALGPEEQEQLLALLDLALALLDRLEAARGGWARSGPAGEEMPPPPPARRALPTPEETPLEGDEEEEEEDGEEEEEEEEEDGEEEEEAEEAGCPPLDALRQAVAALEEEVLVRQEAAPASLLQKRVKALRSALNRSARRQMRRLDRLESRLHEALLLRGGGGRPPLAGALRGGPVGRLRMAAWDFTDALWRFLRSDARQGLPARLAAWRAGAEALLGKLRAAPREGEASALWREALAARRVVPGFLREEAGQLDAAAAALLQEAREGEGGALRRRLAALRRGPLAEVRRALGRQAGLEAASAALLAHGGAPPEAAGALAEAVGAVTPALLKGVGGLPAAVGAFLGVGGESSREVLARLRVPLREVEALAESLEAACEALFRLTRSVPVEAPQRKVRAVARKLADLNRALRAAGRAALPLEEGEAEVPLEELANLSEKLWSLRGILRMREAAQENGPQEGVEGPEWAPPGLDPPTLSPAWRLRTPDAPPPPRTTSKAQERNAGPLLAPTSTAGSLPRGSKGGKQPRSKQVFHVTSSASIAVTPLHQRRPAPSLETAASTPGAGQDPAAALAQGPAAFCPSHKRPRGPEAASTGLDAKGCQAPAGPEGPGRSQRQGGPIPGERSDAGGPGELPSFCSQDGASGPPSRRPETQDPEGSRRNVLAQELFAAYKDFANYVADASDQDREEVEQLLVEFLHPSRPLRRLEEEAEALAAHWSEALAGHLRWLKEGL